MSLRLKRNYTEDFSVPLFIRSLRYIKVTKDLKIYLSVGHNCYSFQLLNRKELFDIIENILSKTKHTKVFETSSLFFNNVILPCQSCAGNGKKDWVEKIINKQVDLTGVHHVDMIKFKKSESNYLICYNDTSLYIFGLCNLKKKLGEYYCDTCNGTGLLNYKIIKQETRNRIHQIECRNTEIIEVIGRILDNF